MRKVHYGCFVDFMPPEWEPDQPIGMHIYIRHAEEESLKTAGNEYYIVENGKKEIIKDANIIEKANAKLRYLLNPNKKKIVGERSNSKVNPYSDPNPQLGVKLNEDGKKIIDDSYYNSAEKRVEQDQSKSKEEKVKELEKIKEKYEEVKNRLEEEQDIKTGKTFKH